MRKTATGLFILAVALWVVVPWRLTTSMIDVM
jgi:hypothetical protein